MTKQTSEQDWAAADATPSLADFEALVLDAFGRLPAHFRTRCGDILIRVTEFAADEALAALGLDSPYDLLGLYQGVSLDRKSVQDLPYGPDMVFLYRRPILDYSAATGESLRDIIAHVLVHEIGHHFGLSDADMAEIEAAAD